MAKKVAVIDYGMGNLHSVSKALAKVGEADVIVTSTPKEIMSADSVVFPGVGAMRDCMGAIHQLDMAEAILLANQTKPVLAICVGLQALMQHSDENDGVDCLGVLPGQVHFFNKSEAITTDTGLKVPHMGWNQVSQAEHPLWSDIPNDTRFYFVHSYYVKSESPGLVYGTTEYGVSFDVALGRENLFGVQFHPEKSQHFGLKLLENFLAWDGSL